MRHVAPLSIIVVTVIAASACSEPSSTGPSAEDLPFASAVVGACEIVNDLKSDVRSYFAQPEQRTASDLARDLGSACNAGIQATTASISWQIMGMIQSVIAENRPGDPAVGSTLVNELLACTTSLCMSSALPGINFFGSLEGAGLFAIRTGGTAPALAGALVPFTDTEGNANTALWGVSVDQPWDIVTGASPVLVYGQPVGAGPAVPDLHVGNLRYDLNVFPDAGEFQDGALHVGVCFGSAFDLPLVAGADPGARMQRNNVVLEDHEPVFCAPLATASSASVLGPLVSLVRSILPARLTASLRVTRVGVIGGTPLDFSTFAPIAANTAGELKFVSEPNPVVIAGQPVGVIRVSAQTGSLAPMEKVRITLSIRANSGVPAGAVLSGDVESFTSERAGEAGIATFPDDGAPVSVGKAGGYRICANGVLAGFTFTEVCSAVFNARNAN